MNHFLKYVGQVGNLQRFGNPPVPSRARARLYRLAIGPQVTNLPHQLRLLIFTVAGCIFAQPGAPVKLNLQDAEALALKNQPRVLAAQNEQSAMNQRVYQARSAYYPHLDGDITGSQANPRARIGAGLLNDPSLFNHEGQGFVLSQLITDSGRTPNLVASSRLQAGAAGQAAQAAKYDVLLSVNQSYFGTLRAQAMVKVARETVEARQYLADQVTQLFNNKLKSQVDVAFADVELSRAKLLVLQTQDQVQQAFAELTRALGSQDAATYQLSEEPMPPSPPASVEDLVQQALKARPELASLQLNREAAYKFERAEKDLSLPNASFLGVGGYISYIAQLQLPRVTPPEYEAVGINVQIPIFNGGLFKARREEAHYRAMEADQRLRDEAESVSRDVRTAWAGLSVAYQRLDVTAEMLRAATQAQQLAKGRYDLGLSSIVELTDSELNLTDAEIANLSAKYDYQSQYAMLQYTTGALR
jgi:outer membrane protein